MSFLPFRLFAPKAPGNYTILAHADDYSWVIVSDPTGKSGYILTRSKTISPETYQQLLSEAKALGVTGNSPRPSSSPSAGRVPAGIRHRRVPVVGGQSSGHVQPG